MVAAAALAWAAANIIAKSAGSYDPLAFAVWTSAVAAPVLLALSLAFDGAAALPDALSAMTWRGAGAVLYLAYPISLLSIALWNGLLQRHAVVAVAPFALLVPVIGLALGHILLDEPPSATLLTGSGLILCGLTPAVLAPRAL